MGSASKNIMIMVTHIHATSYDLVVTGLGSNQVHKTGCAHCSVSNTFDVLNSLPFKSLGLCPALFVLLKL